MSNLLVDYLIERGWVRKSLKHSDYIIISSNPKVNPKPGKEKIIEYAIKISDFVRALEKIVVGGDVTFTPGSSGLTAQNVQDAILEVQGLTVNITLFPADVLAMGVNNVVLLPPPGANKYYDIEEVVMVVDYNSAAYSAQKVALYGAMTASVETAFLTATTKRAVIIKSPTTSGDMISYNIQSNDALKMGTVSNANPTTGDSKINVTIKYKIRTY